VNWETIGETPAAICTVDLTTFGVVAGAEQSERCMEPRHTDDVLDVFLVAALRR